MSHRHRRESRRRQPELQWLEDLGDAFLRQTGQLIGATIQALVAVAAWVLGWRGSREGKGRDGQQPR